MSEKNLQTTCTGALKISRNHYSHVQNHQELGIVPTLKNTIDKKKPTGRVAARNFLGSIKII